MESTYIYNINFMMERSAEQSFLAMLRNGALHQSVENHAYRLVKVIAVPDDPEFSSQALSISLQIEFENLSSCRKWQEEHLSALLDAFHNMAGHQNLHFQTILKTIDL